MKFSSRNTPRGIALPMTIIAIAALVLLFIGLITVLTLERKTARSFSDATRADFAVESGLAVALGSLTEIAERDDSIVFRLEDPIEAQIPDTENERPLGYREQFFTYGAIYEDNAWRGLPLFSNGDEQTLGTGRIDLSLLGTSLNAYVEDVEELIDVTEHDQNIPRAQWVEVPADPAEDKDYTMRYAYWVEDLSGRVDGRNVTSEPYNLGVSTAEMDASTIINPGLSTGAFPTIMDQKREALRTSSSLRLYLGEEEAKRIEPYIHYYGREREIIPQAVIPQGLGYEQAGEPAPDLNAFVAATDVQGIADHISVNLPNFDSRKGGFPASENYLQTLAASIIDYADSDNNATIGPGYRGVDSYPFVNELYDRYEWAGGDDDSIDITVETYVELWNPSDKATSGVVFFVNENRHDINVPPSDYEFTNSRTYVRGGVTIPANGFEVIFLGTTTYTFPINSDFKPTTLTFPDTQDSNFTFRWNGRLVDRARGGLMRQNSTMGPGSGQRDWKGNASMALDTRIDQDGDPRASYYIAAPVFFNTYRTNSNWGGRSLKRDIGNPAFNEVKLGEWEDSGTDSTPGTQPEPRSDAVRPNTLSFPANQPGLAPASISNAGRYNSLAELGNIFDPAQWERVNGDINAASPALRPNPNSSSGGGFTLAIGRPEFGAFDTEGIRSAQLLDLFSIQPEVSATTLIGRPVNINTAPREVLRSLVAWVDLEGDPATPTADVPEDSEPGDIFADYVIAQRSLYPLRGPSDLNNIRLNPATPRNPSAPQDTPFFGSLDAYPAGSEPPASWDDAGREELFRKTLNMITYSSKTYRIVVAGELLNQRGDLVARKTREYHYALEPQRDADTGQIITNGSGVPTMEITKLYEKSY